MALSLRDVVSNMEKTPNRVSPGLKSFLQRWIITTLAVLVAVAIVPGITYDKAVDLFVASLLLGILNAFLRPIMLLLALPLVILTLGLFILVINAFVLYFVGYLLQGFHVEGFWSAFFGALIISIVSTAVNSLTGTGGTRVHFRSHRRPPESTNRSDRDGGNGPVIDV